MGLKPPFRVSESVQVPVRTMTSPRPMVPGSNLRGNNLNPRPGRSTPEGYKLSPTTPCRSKNSSLPLVGGGSGGGGATRNEENNKNQFLISSYKSKSDHLEQKVKDLETENSKLTKLVEELIRQQQPPGSKEISEIGILQRQITEKELENETSQQLLEISANSDRIKSEKDLLLSEKNALIEDLRQQLSKKKSENETLRQQLSEISANSDRIQSEKYIQLYEKKSLISELEQQVSEKKSENGTLRQQLSDLNNQLSEKNSLISQLEQQGSEKKSENGTLREELSDLNNQLSEKNSLISEREGLRQQLSRKKSENETLSQQLSEISANSDRIQSEKKIQLYEKNSLISELERQVSEKKSENVTLLQQLSDLNNQLSEKKSLISKLEQQGSEKKSENVTLLISEFEQQVPEKKSENQLASNPSGKDELSQLAVRGVALGSSDAVVVESSSGDGITNDNSNGKSFLPSWLRDSAFYIGRVFSFLPSLRKVVSLVIGVTMLSILTLVSKGRLLLPSFLNYPTDDRSD